MWQGLPTQQFNPYAKICAMCPNKLAQTYQGQMQAPNQKIKKVTIIILLLLLYLLIRSIGVF